VRAVTEAAVGLEEFGAEPGTEEISPVTPEGIEDGVEAATAAESAEA